MRVKKNCTVAHFKNAFCNGAVLSQNVTVRFQQILGLSPQIAVPLADH